MRTDTHKTKAQLIEELASLRQKVTEFEAEGFMRASAEQALRDGQTQLKRIMSSAMDAIISVDEDQHILFFNASAEKMFRCATAEVNDGQIPVSLIALFTSMFVTIDDFIINMHTNSVNIFALTVKMGALGCANIPMVIDMHMQPAHLQCKQAKARCQHD